MTDNQVYELFKQQLEPKELSDIEFFIRYKRKIRSYAEFMEIVIATVFISREPLSTKTIMRNKQLFLESAMNGLDSFRLFEITQEELTIFREKLETNTIDTTPVKKLMINYFITSSTEQKYFNYDEREDISYLVLKMMYIVLSSLLATCYTEGGSYVVGLYKGDLVCMKLM